MKLKQLITATALAAVITVPAIVNAESDLGFGGSGTTANARVDFRIVIPSFVYFKVGTAGATIDRIDFDLGTTGASEQPGSGNAVNATGGTNDGVDGTLAISLVTNASSVNIAATGGNLDDGGVNTIPFTDIDATDGGNITVPDFGSSVTVNPGSFSLTDSWSYTYANNTVYDAATYNGRTTYTVSIP